MPRTAAPRRFSFAPPLGFEALVHAALEQFTIVVRQAIDSIKDFIYSGRTH